MPQGLYKLAAPIYVALHLEWAGAMTLPAFLNLSLEEESKLEQLQKEIEPLIKVKAPSKASALLRTAD